MSAALGVATAATFVWLGMVLAISFLEAPLKFRAPGVTLPLGLAIGRVVFRALNIVELCLGAVVVVAVVVARPSAAVVVGAAIAVATLLGQVLLVRPVLSRRTDAVLAGIDAPRSHAHHVYVLLEVAKVVALATTGVLLLLALA